MLMKDSRSVSIVHESQITKQGVTYRTVLPAKVVYNVFSFKYVASNYIFLSLKLL